MSLYPTLEDMKVDQMARAQYEQMVAPPTTAETPVPSAPAPTLPRNAAIYPALNDYMSDLGLHLSPEDIAQYAPTAVAVPQPSQVAVPAVQSSGMIAPLSGSSVGLQRAHVTHGIREVVLCKDGKGKVGLRVRGINKGVFVVLVERTSPAALAGVRFGDQILQVNGVNVAGFDTDKVHSMFKKAGNNNIQVALRDRPFERTVTLHKDSVGSVGILLKNGKIVSIVKDSSAARNGVLVEHNMLEVNGQNVVGLKDKETTKLIEGGGDIITFTVMPTFFFEHMMKCMKSSLVKDSMDHSIPAV